MDIITVTRLIMVVVSQVWVPGTRYPVPGTRLTQK